MAASASQPGLSLAGKFVFGSLCAGTFGLGVWQTQRYLEKVELVEARANALAQPPLDVELATSPSDLEQSFRKVRVRGQYLHAAEFLVGPRGPPAGLPGAVAQGMATTPQGYFVLTPLVPASAAVREKLGPLVIVNRGWVPRHMVHGADFRHPGPPRTFAPPTTTLLDWERPATVEVTVVPRKEELPRFFVAEHKLQEQPPRLYWFDRRTMEQWVGWRQLTSERDDDDDDGNQNDDNDDTTTTLPLRLYTAVNDDDDTIHHYQKLTTWPAAPVASEVGHFKVEPVTHAGYALTWYGLSAAGMYMTRKLMTRGRG